MEKMEFDGISQAYKEIKKALDERKREYAKISRRK